MVSTSFHQPTSLYSDPACSPNPLSSPKLTPPQRLQLRESPRRLLPASPRLPTSGPLPHLRDRQIHREILRALRLPTHPPDHLPRRPGTRILDQRPSMPWPRQGIRRRAPRPLRLLVLRRRDPPALWRGGGHRVLRLDVLGRAAFWTDPGWVGRGRRV